MELRVKGNINYCAQIVKIENKLDLEGCDNICGTIIQGNHVIIDKNTEIGSVGIFFPVECAIQSNFLNINNLYSKSELNADTTKKGYFGNNGRVRCVKLRGHKSEGVFMPLSSLDYIKDPNNFKEFDSLFTVGTEFDHIDNMKICEKYVIPVKERSQNQGNKNEKKNKKARFSKLDKEQFRFHIDTSQLAKNIHNILPDDIISITEKLHGTSFIVSNILCNRKLTWKDKIAKKLGVNVKEKEYDNIYASRRVVKNQYICKNPEGYYSEDIWKTVNEELSPYLQKGMTIYGECVGFLKDGKAIQGKHPKIFDYGCEPCQHANYIYRITSTNEDGKVFEWSMLQIQQWCKQMGLNAVPMHYYGTAREYIQAEYDAVGFLLPLNYTVEEWQHKLLDLLMGRYLEKDCTICKNKVPAEGIVLRKETLDIEPYKLKSFAFKALETKMLDEGIENLEDNQSLEEN